MENYSARHLSVLEGLEAVRKRPGMYIGSTDGRGLMHCLWEIIDNSVDEALAGYGKEIRVIAHEDGSLEVQDFGRGIPVDIEPRTGLTGVEVVFTKLHAGGKFGGGSYGASGGLHGVGASVVNALSLRLDVEVNRDGQTWGMSFRRGEPGTFASDQPDAPFKPFEDNSELRKLGKVAKTITGTKVRYWPDRQIFDQSAVFSIDDLKARLSQTAFLVPGLKLSAEDRRSGTKLEFEFEGGISEYVEHLCKDAPVVATKRISESANFKETVPVLDDSGSMVSKEIERECKVEVALRWGTGFETELRSFVNIISTPKGGSHQAGFEQGLLKSIRAAVETNSRKLKANGLKIEREDVMAGLTAVVTVSLPEPQFEGQTKETLGTPAVKQIVANAVSRYLDSFLSGNIRGSKQEAEKILEKIVNEAKARISARTLKDTQRRKNALESSSLPTKLVDCRASATEGSELFIVEGDSALGTAKLARDSKFQALLPIRGKILNVQKASISDMLSNAECASIIQVVGGGSGRTFDLEQVRYEKIILMSDADVDGAHIRTLLLTLFFRYMRPLVEAGRVYAAVPPLHRVMVQNGRSKEPIYTYSQQELTDLLQRLDKQGKSYLQPIQRYKGLGEMDADQLAETTMQPQNRTLRRITAADAQIAEEMFELLMGSDVAPRKDFIIDAADDFDRERIDA
ncbi:DNA topoisomerase IV subunit B [Aquiluna sp. KACHI24]|uniref:DNA gyrase/topoisomerase IV subunit B n=1 Tax=Aquiluna sp. KACHI24 TaxID=2968831 RepID=UPI0021F9E097|nr:DNA topoisomerase IV subunit B [Aquiluna sp. KACHI24]BDQ00352.1 DNA topoisomerase (ATP-hydrolyzing) [Aquiluna sp. KACHI24]